MKIIVKKFKEDKSKIYKDWGRVLSTEKLQEAKLSLKEENVTEEATALININGEDYWIGIQVEDGKSRPANLDRELNIEHQKMNKDCLDDEVDVSILYDIKAD